MLTLSLIALPFKDPVIIFTLVLIIILLSPIVLKKFKAPSIIGLIIAGVIIGPNGLNLLMRDSSIVLFGTVGLLYIMFLAGLEIDLIQFKRSRSRSIVFGLLTFAIPQSLGTLVGYYFLKMDLLAAILLASMFASHTLITYPIVSRLGLTKSEAVTVAIGGTLITDVLALFVLSVVVQINAGELNGIFWIRTLTLSLVLGFLVFWGIPKIGRWFFRTFEGEGYSHFLFCLTIVFLTALAVKVANLEPIIGAFVAGIALNKLIPRNSPLMNRLVFVGNTLFIPFFLIGVGMLVDFRVFFSGTEALIFAITMVVIATFAKWLAAYFTRLIFSYSPSEGQIIFGLSNSQAAATLAAITIGYQLGILNENVLNGTVIMILVTCLIASFATESAGRDLAMKASKNMVDKQIAPQRILVPISNPQTIENLIEISILLKEPSSPDPIYTLNVVIDDEEAEQKISSAKQLLEHSKHHAASTGIPIKAITRVDNNISSGIIRTIKEININTLVIGWNARITARERIFGSVLDNIITASTQTLVVCKLLYPVSTFQKIRLYLPLLAHYEPGFRNWLQMIKLLSQQAGTSLEITAPADTLQYLAKLLQTTPPVLNPVLITDETIPDIRKLSNTAQSGDLFVFASARPGSISYQGYLDEIPHQLSKYFEAHSFIIVFPEQTAKATYISTLQTDDLTVFPYQKNLGFFNRLWNYFRKLLKFEN